MKKWAIFLAMALMCLATSGCGFLSRLGSAGEWSGEEAAMLGIDIRSGDFVLNGRLYSFPMYLSELLDDGWLIPDSYENWEEFELEPYSVSTEFALFDERNHSILVHVYNKSKEKCGLRDCLIREVQILLSDCRVVLPGAIDKTADSERIRESYGEPDYAGEPLNNSYCMYYDFERGDEACSVVLQIVEKDAKEQEDGQPQKEGRLLRVVYVVQDEEDALKKDSVEVNANSCAAYFNAAMKASFYGDWSDYSAMRIDNKAGATELFEQEVYHYSEALLEYLGVDVEMVSEETLAAFDLVAVRVLSRVRWEVTSVKLDGVTLTGEMGVKLYPSNFMDLIEEDVTEAAAAFQEKYADVDMASLDEDGTKEMEQEYADKLLRILENRVDEVGIKEGIEKTYPIDCAEGLLSDSAWFEIDDIVTGIRGELLELP